MRFTHRLTTLALAIAMAVLVLPSAALAGESTQGAWLAAASQEATAAGNTWGRMTLRDGILSFVSLHGEVAWDVDLLTARRVESSKVLDKAIEVEDASGRVFFVTVLDARMMVDSPKRAMKVMTTTMRDTGLESRRLAAAARDGGADKAPAPTTDSTKVVTRDGGRIR